jgi:tripartite-type tricarboxylate transporter receptor subunit TctC
MRRRAILLAGLATPALAQPARRPLRLVAPFPPGGAVDSLARILADRLAPVLDQTVLVENRVGGGGIVGADAIAKGPADGSIAGLIGAATLLAAPLLQSLPFDPQRDLKPVSQVSDAAVLIVANGGIAEREGWRDLPALLDAARRAPGRIRIGTTGVATVSHLTLAAITASAGVEVLHVPYRGGAEGAQAVLSGEVEAMCDLPPLLSPQVTAGRLRALAVSSARRLRFLPDVPAMGEFAATRALDIRSWNMLCLPGATPDTEALRLSEALLRIADPAFRAALAPLSYDAVTSPSPAAAARMIAEEAPRWRELVRLSGARAA